MAPIPAVNAIASAPQNVMRTMGLKTSAPPVLAPSKPSRAKEANDPTRTGASLLERFDNKARKHYIDGLEQKADKNIEGARKLFKKAMDYAGQGGNYYKRARDALDGLE